MAMKIGSRVSDGKKSKGNGKLMRTKNATANRKRTRFSSGQPASSDIA